MQGGITRNKPLYKTDVVTTEQVSKYHPDKYTDQILDAIVAACLEEDPLTLS